MLVQVEAEAGLAELLFAEFADHSMRSAEARAAVVADGFCLAPTGRTERIRQVPIVNDPATEVVHCAKTIPSLEPMVRCLAS
jgi:hypothetical protein